MCNYGHDLHLKRVNYNFHRIIFKIFFTDYFRHSPLRIITIHQYLYHNTLIFLRICFRPLFMRPSYAMRCAARKRFIFL